MLCGGHFLSALGYASLILLPLYLDHLGASRTEIGIIVAASSVAGLVLRPLSAWALDVLGRKPSLVGGTLLLALSMGMLFFVTDLGPLIYLDRLVYGVAMAVLFPGFFALAADLVPPSRRTEGIALFGVTGLIPLAFNPLVARVGIHPPDLRWFFPLVGLVILLSLGFILAVRSPGLKSAPGTFKVRDALRALSRRPLWPVWVATIIFSGLVSTFFAFATVAAAKRSIADPASIWFAYAAGAAAVRLLGSRLPDRVGTWNMVAPSLALYVVGTLVLAGAWSSEALLTAGLLAGMGHGYGFPVLSSQVVTRTPDELRGTGMAMYTALWEVATLGLTPLFGVLADAAGDAVLFSTAALWAILSMTAWAVMEHRLGRAR